MLRQRSSEVMDRTCETTLSSARWTRRLPDNWLSSQLVIFARVRERGVGAYGWRKLHCEHYMANRLTDEECKYGAKKQRKLRGEGCIFNSEWAMTFHGIRASSNQVQRRRRPYCVACNNYAFWYRSRRKTRCEASHRAGSTPLKGAVTFGQHQ